MDGSIYRISCAKDTITTVFINFIIGNVVNRVSILIPSLEFLYILLSLIKVETADSVNTMGISFIALFTIDVLRSYHYVFHHHCCLYFIFIILAP